MLDRIKKHKGGVLYFFSHEVVPPYLSFNYALDIIHMVKVQWSLRIVEVYQRDTFLIGLKAYGGSEIIFPIT